MANRLNLQTTFEEILCNRNVYFQPPSSVQMKYPAIVYNLSDIGKKHANNRTYKKLPSYTVTLIDRNPDSEYVDKILELPYCSFDRFYTANNLNHFVFTIYNIKGGIKHDETYLGSDW